MMNGIDQLDEPCGPPEEKAGDAQPLGEILPRVLARYDVILKPISLPQDCRVAVDRNVDSQDS